METISFLYIITGRADGTTISQLRQALNVRLCDVEKIGKSIFNKMNLRKATFSELPIIWGILQQAIEQRKQDGSEQWQNGYPSEQTVYDDITSSYAYVLIDNDVVIAYAAIIFGIEPAYNEINGKWLTDDAYATVHRVATSNEVKGKGVATELFRRVEDLCIQQKIYSIKVDTNFDNIPMLKILDKLGYSYCGEIIFSGAPRKAYQKVIPMP